MNNRYVNRLVCSNQHPTRGRRWDYARLANDIRVPYLLGPARVFPCITALALFGSLLVMPVRAADVGTAFTYQGVLERPVGTLVDDSCTLSFKLCDDGSALCTPGLVSNHPDVEITDGVFTVPDVDFGADAFNGDARWLEVSVQCSGDGAPVALSPRVELTPTPYALRAAEGVGPPGVLNVSPEGNVGIGAESASQKLFVAGNIRATAEISSGGTISMYGNFSCQTPDSLRTTDVFELYVFNTNACSAGGNNNSYRALRVDKGGTTDSYVNWIGGYSTNNISAGVDGATISGGGAAGFPNRVTDDFGAIGGGQGNQAGNLAGTNGDRPYATVGGGTFNTASGSSSTVGGGLSNNASGDISTVGGGGQNTASNQLSTVGGGTNNAASGIYSTVGGGYFNTASGLVSPTVSGGSSNTASANLSTVGGGNANVASGEYTTIAGGRLNVAMASYCTISGGGPVDPNNLTTTNNVAYDIYDTIGGGGGNRAGSNDANPQTGIFATVGGGNSNTASGNNATVGGGDTNIASHEGATVAGGFSNLAGFSFATVGGGWDNNAVDFMTTVAGGNRNTATGHRSTVGGGAYNMALAPFATIAGGGPSELLNDPFNTNNEVYDEYGTIGGGGYNRAGTDDANATSAIYTTVAGGYHNTASGPESFAGGGYVNIASGNIATVSGGQENVASGGWGTVGGGARNVASGFYSTVSGGDTNVASNSNATVVGGLTNTASGVWSTVGGGAGNKAGGLVSFAAGRRAIVRDPAMVGGGDPDGDQGTFVWADSTNADFQSTGPNQFLIRANGGVGVNKNNPASALDVNGTTTTTGFTMPTGAGAGLVLTSNASGVGTWQPGGAGANNWALLGNTGTVAANFLGTTDNNDLRFKTNNLTRLTVTAAGPTTIANGQQIQAEISGGARILGAQGNSATTPAIGFTGEAPGLGNGIFRPAANLMAFATSGTERMRINASGAVGIGTAAPTSALDVNGTSTMTGFRLTTGAANGLILTSNGTGVGTWQPAPGAGSNWGLLGNAGTVAANYLGTTDSNDLRIKTNNVTRLTVAAAGQTTIATGQRIQSEAAGGARILGAQGNTAATPAIGFFSSNGVDDGGGGNGIFRPAANVMAFSTSSAERMRITSTGLVGVGRAPVTNRLEVEGDASKTTAGAWLANSDRCIKTDIESIDNALETIDRLHPVKFKYTDEYRAQHGSIEDVPYYNFIAQEFRDVFPNQVKDSGEDGVLQIDSYPASIVAVAAIQELHQIVQDKDCQLSELHEREAAKERRIDELESRLAAVEKLLAGVAAANHGGGQ